MKKKREFDNSNIFVQFTLHTKNQLIYHTFFTLPTYLKCITLQSINIALGCSLQLNVLSSRNIITIILNTISYLQEIN